MQIIITVNKNVYLRRNTVQKRNPIEDLNFYNKIFNKNFDNILIKYVEM